MKAWIKAGLVGGAILGFFTLLSTFSYYIPQLDPIFHVVFNCCYYLLLYPAIGVLAAIWMPSVSSPGEGAKYGAQAGLLAGLIDSAVTTISSIGVAFFSGPEVVLNQFSPETISRFQERGLDWFLSTGGIIGSALCSSVITMVLAVSAGTIICLIYTSLKKKE